MKKQKFLLMYRTNHLELETMEMMMLVTMVIIMMVMTMKRVMMMMRVVAMVMMMMRVTMTPLTSAAAPNCFTVMALPLILY